jgi:hypothetical protein
VYVADHDRAIAWFRWRVGDEEEKDGFVVLGVRDGLIATVTDFWPEPYEPPASRAHLTERW